jgi:hypothetical protein
MDHNRELVQFESSLGVLILIFSIKYKEGESILTN